MPRLPTAEDLGVVTPQPGLGVAPMRGETGMEGAAARGIQQAGNEFGEVSAYLLKAQDENDRMAAEDALNKYRGDLLKRQYDEKEGWQGQLGEAATNSENMKRHTEYFGKSRDQIASTLSERAKRYFSPQAEASRMHAEASFFGHVSTQRLSQEVKIFEAGQQLLMDGVSRQPLGAAGDELMTSSIQESRAKTEVFALRRGFSPEEATALANDAITRIVATRIDGALNANNATEAKRIYDENEKLLGQKGRMMAGKVNDAYLKSETMRIADAEVDKIVADVEAKRKDVPPGGIATESPRAAPLTPGRQDYGTVTGSSSTARVTFKWQGKLPDSAAVRFTPDIDNAIAAASGGDAQKQAFLRNVVAVENAGFGEVRSDKVSPAGAAGAFQIIPSTAKGLGLSDADRANPQKAATAAAKLYDELNAKYGGNRMAMAAHYNGGAAAGEAVMQGKMPPAKETRDYLQMFQRAEGTPPQFTGNRTFVNDSVMFQTSRVRDLQEEARTLEQRITEAYRAKFGDSNPEGRELALQRGRALLSTRIQQENAIQQGNLNEITTTIINNGIDNFGALQQVPGMAEKLRTAGPYIQHIVSLMNMVGHQKSGDKLKGDNALYFDLAAKILGGHITKDQDLLPYLMDPARPGRGLDMQQFNSLQQQISRAARPETRDTERQLHIATRMAGRTISTIAGSMGIVRMDGMPQNAEMIGNALERWEMDARTALAGAPADQVTRMLDPNSPDFIGTPQKLAPYFVQAREGLAPGLKQVAQPKTPEEIAALPQLKKGKQDVNWSKFPAAKMTPEGWQGGWYRDAENKPKQKKPTTAEMAGG